MTALTNDDKARDVYLRSLLAAIAADGVVEDHEVLQIYELFALFETSAEERCALIEALWANPSHFVTADEPEALKEDAELRAALARDVAFIEAGSGKSKARAIAEQLRSKFALGAEQIGALRRFVDAENAILRHLGAGEEWLSDASSPSENISRAAALGIPLAALNVAGVSGLSVVGITSGLASLGSVSGLAVLGLNPMTAGIGALILMGITVKKVADYALSQAGSDDTDSAALEEVRLLRRRTASYVAQDLAAFRRPRRSELILVGRKRRREELAMTMERTLESAMPDL